MLTGFYHIGPDQVGWYILPFAAGGFLGPLVLGRLFDTIGRRPMIAGTYAIQQAIAWMVIFFLASAAASSAYLTVSETFPLEIRALAIALFFAIGTPVGAPGPWLFGVLIDSGSRMSVFIGYLIGSAMRRVGPMELGCRLGAEES